MKCSQLGDYHEARQSVILPEHSAKSPRRLATGGWMFLAEKPTQTVCRIDII